MPRWTHGTNYTGQQGWKEVEDIPLTRDEHALDFPPISPWRAQRLFDRWEGWADTYAGMLPRWTDYRAWDEVTLGRRLRPEAIRETHIAAWDVGYSAPGDFANIVAWDGSHFANISIGEARDRLANSIPAEAWRAGDNAVVWEPGALDAPALYGDPNTDAAMKAMRNQTITLATGNTAQRLQSDPESGPTLPVVYRTKMDETIFLESGLRVAGAILWRMWFIACRLTEDDWLQQNEGGRGGVRGTT